MKEEEKELKETCADEHTQEEYAEAIKGIVDRAGFDSCLILLINSLKTENGKVAMDSLIFGDLLDISAGIHVLLQDNPRFGIAMSLTNPDGRIKFEKTELPY